MVLMYGWSILDGLVENMVSERYIIIYFQRISIQATRDIINAIHDGSLAKAEYKTLPIFNLQYPAEIKGVSTKILNPKTSWIDGQEYDDNLKKVATMFA